MSDERSGSLGYLSIVAIAIAIVALAVGMVLPNMGDVFLSDLGDVKTNNLLSDQILVYNGTSWVNSNSKVSM